MELTALHFKKTIQAVQYEPFTIEAYYEASEDEDTNTFKEKAQNDFAELFFDTFGHYDMHSEIGRKKTAEIQDELNDLGKVTKE